MMTNDAIGLARLVANVKESLQRDFTTPVWIVAEIMEINLNRSGHCYLELIEKDTLSDKIIAKSRATIWAVAYRMIKPYFETTTGESLKAGLKVLVRVTVEFHEVYGFSLNIQDIDPQYTLGDMARQRAQVIEQLRIDGILDLNKQTFFPLVPQRIAVVTSDSAAGWGDFEEQLKNNPWGYDFDLQLFAAVMQGDKAPFSIIDALNRIFEHIDDFDVVALIRGGGSKADLLCFDHYDLASFIAQFPIPVLTGIGHERDDSVADLVAHTRLKTPTALAAFLIEKVREFEQQLDFKCDLVFDSSLNVLAESESLVEMLSKRLEFANRQLFNYNQENLNYLGIMVGKATNQYFVGKQSHLQFISREARTAPVLALNAKSLHLDQSQRQLKLAVNRFFSTHENLQNLYDSKNRILDPAQTLKRGFAIIRRHDKLITQTHQVQNGDKLTIQLADGIIQSYVEQNNL